MVMDDLISRQAAIDLIMETDPFWAEGTTRAIFDGIKQLPAARKKGKWINYEQCSVCGDAYEYDIEVFNYCPNCGAEMEGEYNE